MSFYGLTRNPCRSQNLTLADTEELQADIRLYLTLETAPANVEFWKVRLSSNL